MNSSLQDAALKACRHFMLPIARFLIRNGIGYREFSEISKLAFVQVASDEYGIRGRKTNMSRVSVMTGLNRKEIRKIRDRLENEDWDLDPALSKPVSVLAEWFTGPKYLTPRGAPKILPFSANEGRVSFSSLVRDVGGDVPPGAMLKELVRAGCVKQSGSGLLKAIKRQYAPGAVDPFVIERFGECLHDLAQTMANNMGEVDPSKRLFEFRAWSDRIDALETPKLRDVVTTLGHVYLESIDDWLGANAIRATAVPSDSTPIRCGVGVYYFETPALEHASAD
jgi:hypothetical protein